MDAWTGRMPWLVVWFFLITTSATASSPADRPVRALSPTVAEQPQPPAVDRKQINQPSRPATLSSSATLQSAPKARSPRQATFAEPAPPPDVPPSEAAPAGAGFTVPTLGEVYVPEVPIDLGIPVGLVPPVIEQNEAQAQDDAFTIDHTWREGDAGLRSLCELPGITALTIKNAQLTDAALDYIAAIPNLKTLTIESTPFSAAALAKLQRKRPIEVIVASRKTMDVSPISR